MSAGDWNFLAGRLTGDGSIDIFETELPIVVTSLDRRVSAPSSISGSITNSVKRLQYQGRPMLIPGNTVIVAEASGQIRGMGIYQEPTFTGASWAVEAVGLPSYAIGLPYDSDTSFTDADPLDMYRHLWAHIQEKPRGNIGLTFDSTTSPVRRGTPTVEGDNASGPIRYTPWDTKNIGSEIDALAREAPFDWLETFSWQGDQPHCHVKLGYPLLGGRNDAPYRLVLGENLATDPTVTEGGSVNEVWVYGAGEGREKVQARASVNDGQLRRIEVVEDSEITSSDRALARAHEELNGLRGHLAVDTLEVFDHPNAPLEALEPGLELPLYIEGDHVTFDDYVRIVGKSESPEASDRATLTVTRMLVA